MTKLNPVDVHLQKTMADATPQQLKDVEKNGVAVVATADVKVDIDKLKAAEKSSDGADNPWALDTTVDDEGPKWSELTCRQKTFEVLKNILRFLGILLCLYFFISSLVLLGSSFQLIGGKAIGKAFRNSKLLRNPFCGLVIGIIVTAVLQSSSTTTSIIVTMVASEILTVKLAIPIVMGANIGTSVTGIIVSVAQSGDKLQFRRAFGAATVHDMFNWLSVIVLLPIEIATGFLYHLTDVIAKSAKLQGGGSKISFLKGMTKPITDLIVQLDKKVLTDIAVGKDKGKPLLKYWCKTRYVLNISDTTQPDVTWTPTPSSVPVSGLTTVAGVSNFTTVLPTMEEGVLPCCYLFHGTTIPEPAVGAILLIMSLGLLITCLLFLVKILKALLSGSLASVVKKTVNADFPYPFGWLAGYLAIIVGAVLTTLVQSSSVVASTLTPLVGVGMFTIQRVFPMLLGANIGTTSTGFLSAFASPKRSVTVAFQIALCHLFFNILGIVIWYPIPFMRKVPIGLAQFLGNTTAEYRWFAFAYLIAMFFLMPLIVFGLSLGGIAPLLGVLIPLIVLAILIGITNCLQNRKPNWLPKKLRSWEFLPTPLRSLKPYDTVITKSCTCCSCCNNPQDENDPANQEVYTMKTIDEKPAQHGAIPTALNQSEKNTNNNSHNPARHETLENGHINKGYVK